ncbi:hypothetical protein [Fulvivirga lutea]|uniref:Uncharacterized protein n=1 Tax=Fulvivirga lutea TaxID=2810512 RepID=A0A974WLZ0_9BACT|nr:hypothetical protein [Fulvivirga lutea]QSE97848.1 hypothetical protein JR347_01805 [Fulvivirga lutea]
MKNNLYLMLLVFLILYSCGESTEPMPEIGELSFNISDTSIPDGRVEEGTFSKIIFALKNNDQDAIIDTIEVVKFGDSYQSEVLSLEVGEYSLEEFLVLNDENEVTYATPVSGSDTEHLVDTALPLSFTISTNETVNVAPQVVSTAGFTPEDFGYLGISFEPVDIMHLVINLFRQTNDGFNFVSGSVSISNETEVLYEGELLNQSNSITIRKSERYYIEIEKEGFNTYSRTFTTQELDEFDGILNITMNPSASSVILRYNLPEGVDPEVAFISIQSENSTFYKTTGIFDVTELDEIVKVMPISGNGNYNIFIGIYESIEFLNNPVIYGTGTFELSAGNEYQLTSPNESNAGGLELAWYNADGIVTEHLAVIRANNPFCDPVLYSHILTELDYSHIELLLVDSGGIVWDAAGEENVRIVDFSNVAETRFQFCDNPLNDQGLFMTLSYYFQGVMKDGTFIDTYWDIKSTDMDGN